MTPNVYYSSNYAFFENFCIKSFSSDKSSLLTIIILNMNTIYYVLWIKLGVLKKYPNIYIMGHINLLTLGQRVEL